MVLFQDESGYCRHPKLGRLWAKRGKRPVVTTRSQRGGRLNLFGWVNPLTGEHGVMKAVQGNTEAFLAQLQMLVERFRGKIVDLWVDNASWHKGQRVRKFLEPHRRWFHLHYEFVPKLARKILNARPVGESEPHGFSDRSRLRSTISFSTRP